MLAEETQTPILTSVHRRVMRLEDIFFEVSVVAEDILWANERVFNAFAEIARIEQILSDTDPQSQASLINSSAGIYPVKVSQEVYNLIGRALKISELTGGSFEITRNTASEKDISYRNVILNQLNTTVYLNEAGMKLDFSNIAKGYIADSVKYLLKMQGVNSGVINASGNLVTWGYQPNGKPWTVAAAAPDQHIGIMANLDISNMAVVTSGVIDGSGSLPVNGVKSVSILSPSAELADAMRAPVMKKGVKLGLRLINHLNQLACIITNKRKKVYTSKNLAYR